MLSANPSVGRVENNVHHIMPFIGVGKKDGCSCEQPLSSAGAVCKPNSVPAMRGRPFLYDIRCRMPPAAYPQVLIAQPTGPVKACACLLLGLARSGVCHARAITDSAVCSYHTFSPLPVRFRAIGGIFSVALSLTEPSPTQPVGVTHHCVLPCSDFPLQQS